MSQTEEGADYMLSSLRVISHASRKTRQPSLTSFVQFFREINDLAKEKRSPSKGSSESLDGKSRGNAASGWQQVGKLRCSVGEKRVERNGSIGILEEDSHSLQDFSSFHVRFGQLERHFQ